MAGGFSGFAGGEKYKISLKGNKLFGKLLRLAKPFWKWFLLALILILVIAGVEILRPHIIRILIDDNIQKAVEGEISTDMAEKNVRVLAAYFVFLMLFQFVLNYFQIVILQKTGLKIVQKLRDRLFSHVQKLPFSYFEKIPAGVVVTRITNDTEAINEMYTGIIVNFIKELIVMIGILIVIFIYNYKIALLLLILIPIVMISISLFRKHARKIFNEIRNRLAWVNAFLSEHFMGVKLIRAFNMTNTKKKEFENISEEYKKSHDKMTKLFGFFRPFMDFLNEMAVVIILWYGIREVFNSSLQIGMLYMFIRYTTMLFHPVIRVSEMFNTLQSSLVASERIFDILELQIEKNYDTGIDMDIKGEIEFKNVWFAYIDEEWILKDVSFKIKKGEFTAFVGATGAGKTTIINLICGFYEINKGSILLDGIDIGNISKRSLRKNIGLVLQDVMLFKGNVMDNIRLNSNISDQEVIKASKHADAHRFIQKLDKGYESNVYYGGSTFSNGERQLLSFARAIVKDPIILVLDEATSNVDTQTEGIIQNSLKRISENRTTVAIAHRLSTIKSANKIIVIHKGRIAETGDHESLMEKRGLYFKLYSMQFTVDT